MASSPYGIQENIITPTYENDFVLCKYELIINEIYYIKLQWRHCQFLQLKEICQYYKIILSQFLNVLKCSHPFEMITLFGRYASTSFFSTKWPSLSKYKPQKMCFSCFIQASYTEVGTSFSKHPRSSSVWHCSPFFEFWQAARNVPE